MPSWEHLRAGPAPCLHHFTFLILFCFVLFITMGFWRLFNDPNPVRHRACTIWNFSSQNSNLQAKGVPLGYGAVVLCRADNKEMGKQPIIVVDKISKCASYFLSMQCWYWPEEEEALVGHLSGYCPVACWVSRCPRHKTGMPTNQPTIENAQNFLFTITCPEFRKETSTDGCYVAPLCYLKWDGRDWISLLVPLYIERLTVLKYNPKNVI